MYKNILNFLLLAILFAAPAAIAQEDMCVTCHQDIEEEDGPSYIISRDIHIQKGLSCADCHGGDPTLDDMDDVRDSKGYIGAPDHFDIPAFCSRCHSDAAYMHEYNPKLPTDQLAKYKTSGHGKRFFGKKDSKVATCISCHSVHEIGDARLPHSSTYPTNIPETCGKCHGDEDYMEGTGLPTAQLRDYKESVHGYALLEKHDLGAPACNDCHGNHGAAPPGVANIQAVCGNCHAFEAELFSESPHMKAFEENNFPMCETCHSNHRIVHPYDKMIGSSQPAICAQCHSHDDGTNGLKVADSMAIMIEKLIVAHDAASSILNDAIVKGMPTMDEEFRMREVEQTLIQTRTMLHSFNIDQLTPKAVAGIAMADTVQINSAALIDDFHFRRQGLVWASIFITLAALGLYLKIRKLD